MCFYFILSSKLSSIGNSRNYEESFVIQKEIPISFQSFKLPVRCCNSLFTEHFEVFNKVISMCLIKVTSKCLTKNFEDPNKVCINLSLFIIPCMSRAIWKASWRSVCNSLSYEMNVCLYCSIALGRTMCAHFCLPIPTTRTHKYRFSWIRHFLFSLIKPSIF